MVLARPLLGEKSLSLHPIRFLSVLPLPFRLPGIVCLLCRVWSVLVDLNEIISIGNWQLSPSSAPALAIAKSGYRVFLPF